MTTTSANVAGVAVPLGAPLGRPWQMGVYDASKVPGSKKRKRREKGVHEMLATDSGLVLEGFARKDEQRYKVNGKKGVWRTVRGRHYFFPDDGSGVFPPIKGV